MKIGVITAMDNERAQIAAMMQDAITRDVGVYSFTNGKIGNNEIVLAASGIGKVNAALGATAMISAFKPDAIVSTGVAGGVDPARADVMDVVVSSELVYHDVDCGFGNAPGQVQGLPPRFAADTKLLATAKSIKTKAKIADGLIATGDKFVSRPEDLAAIKALFPETLAVDMESCSLAHTCYLAKIPFISFRIISDIPGVENHYSAYTDFWTRMSDSSFAVIAEFLKTI